MAKKVKQIQPPKGLSRLFYRAPIWLYRLKLGWLLGHRFLLLNHTGRKSGLPRQAVLEVVRFDPATDTYVVMVGFGEKSQWYQNLLHTPQATIQSGGHKLAVTAEQLSPQQSGEELLDFCKRHPVEARFLSLGGYEVDGSDEDYRAAGEMAIMMAFRPR
jgi:deazaflavin-dependent oxidoreductase (nitroreductase family)